MPFDVQQNAAPSADSAPDGSALTGASRQARKTAVDPRLPLRIAKEKKMLWTICIILLVLWALGMATAYTAGGLIHLLLLVAVVVLVFRLVQGRRLV
jgi:hypothetical protein